MNKMSPIIFPELDCGVSRLAEPEFEIKLTSSEVSKKPLPTRPPLRKEPRSTDFQSIGSMTMYQLQMRHFSAILEVPLGAGLSRIETMSSSHSHPSQRKIGSS